MAIYVVADKSVKLLDLRSLLQPDHRTITTMLNENFPAVTSSDVVIIAANLRAVTSINAVQKSVHALRTARRRIFVVDEASHHLVTQAHALGATHVMEYPVSRQKLLWLVPNRAGDLTSSAEARARVAAKSGVDTVKAMFDAVRQGQPIDVGSLEKAGKDIASCVSQNGLSVWLDIVRRHHEGTYQHCLLVAGVVTGFGLRLGVHSADLKRLYMAALIHDVGKATIPPQILDKPGKLNADERALVETHTVAGYEILNREAGVADEVRQAVRHHHEFLDGSGYPDGLFGDEIPDLVRVLTIADIFAALIEDRRYRPSISRRQAYEAICDMEGKLEKPLIDAFRDVALVD